MPRVTLCQIPVGGGPTAEETRRLSDSGTDFIALPEYVFAPQGPGTQRDLAAREAALADRLARLSVDTGAVVVGGTIVEEREGRLYNACPVFDGGREIARYRKRHPTPGEIRAGIAAGEGSVVVTARGVRIAPLICADVLSPGRFDEVGSLGARILFTPVVSPFRPGDTPRAKDERDRRIFVDGARRANAFVVKTAAPGAIFGSPLQGRSLVAAPWGILARTTPEQEQDRLLLTADLDLTRLGPPGAAATPASGS